MNSILHVGDTAGVPQELSKAQRKLGLKNDVLSFYPHPFNYEVDFFHPIKLPYPFDNGEKFFNLFNILNNYDILHFHYASIFPNGKDFPIWKMLRKKVIMHHHGSDLRFIGERPRYLKYSDKILVSTPDLLEWSPNAVWIPNPINLEKLSYVGVNTGSDEVNIVHAPSKRKKKGTDHVIDAVKKLQNEGYKVNLSLIENIPHNKAIEYYKKADIVVDQLLIGWYGSLTIECMALGKPVCVYIRDDLESYLPWNPFINTSPETIVENLRVLIENESLRKELGENARKYVEEIHDSKKIAQKVIFQYSDNSNIRSLRQKISKNVGKKLFLPLFGSTRENPIIDNKIYVSFGQKNWGEFFATNYIFDPTTGHWSEGSPAKHPRDGVACAIFNNKLYVFGGRDDAPPTHGLDFVEEYDPKTESEHIYPWQIKTPQPSPLADSSAAVHDEIIYIFGGYHPTGADPKGCVYVYDPVNDSWSIKSTMPTAKWGPIAIAAKGKIYLFGGQAQDGCTNVLEIYDPINDSWSTGKSMPYASQGLMGVYCSFDGMIHLFGGYDGHSFRNDHCIYEIENNTYDTRKMNMPTARNCASAAVSNNNIYIIGGYSPTGPTNIIEIYDLTDNSWS